MSVVSLPLPLCKHYLTAWLRWIESNLPGRLLGSELSICGFEDAYSRLTMHGQQCLYADDLVYAWSAVSRQPRLRSSLHPLPATIVEGSESLPGLPHRHGDAI